MGKLEHKSRPGFVRPTRRERQERDGWGTRESAMAEGSDKIISMRSFLFLTMMFLFVWSVRAQDATVPPATQHVVLTVQGQGVQIYACKVVSGSGQWVFVAPAARLFDTSGIEVGSHGDGPVWHSVDGSSVLGKVVAKSPSPDPASVPWLLVKAVSHDGTGVLASVEFIRRSDTKGGVAPATGCDVDHIGDFARVPYTTTYTFYSSK